MLELWKDLCRDGAWQVLCESHASPAQGAFLNQSVDSLSGSVVQEQVTDVLGFGRFLPAPFNKGLWAGQEGTGHRAPAGSLGRQAVLSEGSENMACLRQSSILEGPRHGRCTKLHCRHPLTWAPTPATRTSEVVVVLGPAESDGGSHEGLGVLSSATHFRMAQKRLAWQKQTVKIARLRCCETGAHRDINNAAQKPPDYPQKSVGDTFLCPVGGVPNEDKLAYKLGGSCSPVKRQITSESCDKRQAGCACAPVPSRRQLHKRETNSDENAAPPEHLKEAREREKSRREKEENLV